MGDDLQQQQQDQTYLGLNEHHEREVVLKYMRFMRYQRQLRIRTIEACFDDFQKVKCLRRAGSTSGLMGSGAGDEYEISHEATFSQQDVKRMTEELKDQVKSEMETELLNAAHTNVLLLRQLCGQAENWHLKLTVNLSELENRDMLNALEKFENDQFDASSKLNKQQRPNINVTIFKKLAPMTSQDGSGPSDLLRHEIDRLKRENSQLKSNFQQVEQKAIQAAHEKIDLAEQLSRLSASVSKVEQEQLLNDEAGQREADSVPSILLKEDNEKLSQSLQQIQKNKQDLEENLGNVTKKLLSAQRQLESTEKELEKKFSQTQAYANMKRILKQKNDQIKTLRRQCGNGRSNNATNEDSDEFDDT